MLRFLTIFAGIFLSCSALAESPAYHFFHDETVLRDVRVEPVNGGINPELRAYVIRGRVMLGSNSCFAQGLQGKLQLEDAAEGNRHVVAYVDGRQPADLVCIEIYKPVYADVELTVRGDAGLLEDVLIRNVDEMGSLRSLGDFSGVSLEPQDEACALYAVCTREYRPTACMIHGQSVRGDNPCEARLNVRRHACRNGFTLLENEVSCRPVAWLR